MSNTILKILDDQPPPKTIMCHIHGHEAFPIIFAYITKAQSAKRLFCMQCFKEDAVTDKKQLLELAKLNVDYGQSELAQHRVELRQQLKTYIETLQMEKTNLISELEDNVKKYEQEFLKYLQKTKQTISDAINHQIQYRIDVVNQNMERQISLQIPEEIVHEVISNSNSNYQMELLLNEKFTKKGLVLFDSFNRKCFDLQRVDYMMNSRITSIREEIDTALTDIIQKVEHMQNLYVIPDAQKHEQTTAHSVHSSLHSLKNSIQLEEAPLLTNRHIQKQQIICLISEDINQINVDRILEYGVTGNIINELKEIRRDKKDQILLYRGKDPIQFKQSLDSMIQVQEKVTGNMECNSIILTKEVLQNIIQITKTFELLKQSIFIIKNIWINLSSREYDEKSIKLIIPLITGAVSTIKLLHLDLSYNKLGDSCVQHLRPLLKVSQNLRRLTLKLNNNGFGHHGCGQLSVCLMSLKTLTHLHLHLENNKINDQSCSNLGEALNHLQNITHLGLWLGNNQIGDVGLKQISVGVSQLITLTHIQICCENNKVLSKGLSYIFTQWNELQNLLSLVINFKNNQLLGNLQTQLQLQNYKNLDELRIDVSQNNIGDQGVNKILSSLTERRFLKCLHLHLGQDNISKQGLQIIGNCLNSLHQIEELRIDLENNNLELLGCQYLAFGLKNKLAINVLELKLNQNNISSKGLGILIEEISQMIDLRQLTFQASNNQLENPSQLINSIVEMKQLEQLKLDLSHTMLTKQGLQSICDIKQIKLNRLEINILGNKLTDEDLMLLTIAISRISTLKRYVLYAKADKTASLHMQMKLNLSFIKDLKLYL